MMRNYAKVYFSADQYLHIVCCDSRMSRPLSNVILEVLKTRPSLRDFKAYAHAFGAIPREATAPTALPQPGIGRGVSYGEAPSLTHDPPVVFDRLALNGTPHSLIGAHTALVKVQGPFSDRQLASIAEGLEYLRQLGLLSVIVLDDVNWGEHMWHFNNDGSRDDSEQAEIMPWTAQLPAEIPEQFGRAESGQRHCMVRELWRFSNLLSSTGADTQPIAYPAVRIAAPDEVPPPASNVQRTPMVLDMPLAHLRAALRAGKTPVILPMASYEDMGLRCICVKADDVMVTLARVMTRGSAQDAADTSAEASADVFRGIDLTPVRLMVISREGGVPSHARGGNPHLSINLASELASIHSTFVWQDTHPHALAHVDMLRDCLVHMPSTSSGVLATHRSPRSLIANLITNKAAHSPSLPFRLLERRSDVQHMPTIVRRGLPLRVLSRWEDVDEVKLRSLLEQSFGRKVDPAYFARVAAQLDCVIVTGDYDGVAIVTKEYAPGDPEPIAYLDKFAVLPKLQGSGAVDFLWSALHDEVQGLGMLDALNDNGGKGGFGVGRDLVWKSRAENPVNRWYFERSSGFMRMRIGAQDWVVFWCDAEDRLARLTGRHVLTAATGAAESREWAGSQRLARLAPMSQTADPLLPIVADVEMGRLEKWARCLRTIPGAWR